MMGEARNQTAEQINFECPSFSIQLPKGVKETSTYSFVLPVSEAFSPSVVVKWDDLDSKMLAEYVRGQIEAMREQLHAFRVEEPPEPLQDDVLRLVFEWGPRDRRFRQVQFFDARSAPRVYLITGTLRMPEQEVHQEWVETIMQSVAPAG